MPNVLFVADKFADETRSAREVHPGGAELTDAAAIAACPWPISCRRFGELDVATLARFDAIVVGNSQRATAEELEAIAATRRHVLFEHDVRICVYNGNFPATGDVLHKSWQRCWCPHARLLTLFANARGVIFLTERQRAVYDENPFFASPPSATLGCSLFSRSFFERVHARSERSREHRHGACVVYSPNAIKGHAPARRWAARHVREVREIRNSSPEQVLGTLAECESFVYLPIGLEPAGRVPVEARLFGCDVIVNANVGVAGEEWWRGDRSKGLAWLEDAPHRFWRLTEDFLQRDPPSNSSRKPPLARLVDPLARATRYTRWLTRPLPPSPSVLRRARQIERFEHW